MSPIGVYARPSLETRFWTKVTRGPENECWLWRGAKTPEGYGHLTMDGVVTGAHRVAYTLLVGPIPAGLQLDHLCRTPACVNPKHLEPVTSWENSWRGNSINAVNARKIECPRGHPYSLENTGANHKSAAGRGLGRRCRACDREKHKARYHYGCGGQFVGQGPKREEFCRRCKRSRGIVGLSADPHAIDTPRITLRGSRGEASSG